MDWTAAWVTLRVAACTTAILAALGLPLAYWLVVTPWRGRFLLEAVLSLPIILPPTVLGYYVLAAMTRSGSGLPFTFAGIVVGSVLYNVPFAVRPFTAAFAKVDRRLVEAGWCLGESRFGTFRRVTLPLAWPGVLAGLVLTFAHTVGEFGVVLMLGGNIPGVTRTVAVAIYDDVQALDYGAAGQTAAALLVFSFAVLSLTYALQRRGPLP